MRISKAADARILAAVCATTIAAGAFVVITFGPRHGEAVSRTPAISAPGLSAVRSLFPTSASTGVPPGTRLRPYTGPCQVKDGSTIVIDAKDVAASCDALDAYNGRIVITRSRLPKVMAAWPGSISVSDSDIDGGDQSDVSAAATNNTRAEPAGFNLVLSRVDVHGGKDSVECGGNCEVVDSYLHDQRGYGGAHIQGFLSSGGNHMVVRHNSISCDPPTARQGRGCTADLALFGDESSIRDVVVESNLFISSVYVGYCVYGGNQPGKRFPVPDGVEFIDNAFERGASGLCGTEGPATSLTASGSNGARWSGNRWDDGAPVNP